MEFPARSEKSRTEEQRRNHAGKPRRPVGKCSAERHRHDFVSGGRKLHHFRGCENGVSGEEETEHQQNRAGETPRRNSAAVEEEERCVQNEIEQVKCDECASGSSEEFPRAPDSEIA